MSIIAKLSRGLKVAFEVAGRVMVRVGSHLRSFVRTLLHLGRTNQSEKRVITVSIIHAEGGNCDIILKNYREEIRNSDVIIGKNVPIDFLKENRAMLRSKDVLLITKDGPAGQTNIVDFMVDFDVHKLRNLERKGVKLLVTTNKKVAWMISQMFPFYCICPGEPFEETVVTAPIPLTRNSDGYYFSKIPYKPSVTLIDLNVDIVEEFSNR